MCENADRRQIRFVSDQQLCTEARFKKSNAHKLERTPPRSSQQRNMGVRLNFGGAQRHRRAPKSVRERCATKTRERLATKTIQSRGIPLEISSKDITTVNRATHAGRRVQILPSAVVQRVRKNSQRWQAESSICQWPTALHRDASLLIRALIMSRKRHQERNSKEKTASDSMEHNDIAGHPIRCARGESRKPCTYLLAALDRESSLSSSRQVSCSAHCSEHCRA